MYRDRYSLRLFILSINAWHGDKWLMNCLKSQPDQITSFTIRMQCTRSCGQRKHMHVIAAAMAFRALAIHQFVYGAMAIIYPINAHRFDLRSAYITCRSQWSRVMKWRCTWRTSPLLCCQRAMCAMCDIRGHGTYGCDSDDVIYTTSTKGSAAWANSVRRGGWRWCC